MHRNSFRRLVAAALVVTATTLLAATAASADSSRQEPEFAAIVNGTSVNQAEYEARWPFIVALVIPGRKSQYDGQFCGGSLVDDQHVVTAAHCLTMRNGVIATPRGVGIVANQRVLDDKDLGSGEQRVRPVSEVFVHPDFSENSGSGYHNDIAVLRLEEPIAGARTIRLLQPEDGAAWGAGNGGPTAHIAGWGNTDPTGTAGPGRSFPTVLRQVSVPIRSDAECAASVRGGYGTSFERDSNFCAGILQTSPKKLGQDSCQGDSGGPVIVDAGGGSMRLAGVTSWGDGCAQKNFGAYSRVDTLRAWVNSIPGATDGGPGVGGPGNLHAVPGLRVTKREFEHVTVTWNAPTTGATPERYGIWLRTGQRGDSTDELLGLTQGLVFRAPIPAASSGAGMAIVVRAVDSAGNQGESSITGGAPRLDKTAPTSPGRTTASRITRTSAIVRWNRSSDRQSGLDGYQVQQRVVGRGWVTVDSTMPGKRSSRLTDLRPGVQYQARVRAYDDAGNPSRWSSIVTFRTRR